MGSVATHAALGLDWNVLVDERPLFVSVALITDSVSTGQGSHLPQRRGAVHVMAVIAPDQSFLHAVVVGLGKVCLLGYVTAIAELRLSLDQ